MTQGEREKVCPNCGTALREFQKSGLLGCAQCYHVFEEEVLKVVRRVQGKTRHVEKRESAEEIKEQLYLRRKVLQDRFREALNEEKETEAIELETEIEQLDSTLEGKKSPSEEKKERFDREDVT